MAEINVTPLVDVMLVLLIIFMVAAPLMTVGVPVDLPKTQASALNQENEPITITVNAEINVPPLVDVFLVLLIIFMVAAPLMTVGVPVNLPKTQASALNQENEPITITVNAEKIYLQETEVQIDGLVPQLQAIAGAQQAGQERRIFVRGDRATSYGRVMEVMGTEI